MTRNSPIVLFVMVKFIVWGAFALGLKACLANLWSYTSDNEHFGLWKTCTGTTSKNCEKITADATLNAIRAMVIMGISFAFIGTNFFSTGYWRKGAIKAAQIGIGFIHLGAICWTVGMILFTVTFDDSSIAWGYPYAFGWANVGLLNIGGGLAHAGVSKRKQQIDSLA